MKPAYLGKRRQAEVIDEAQRAVWLLVTGRFGQLHDMAGLTQADLARRLGTSRPQIHEWLSDHRKMSLKAAARLLSAMDASLACRLVVESRPGDSDQSTPSQP